MTNGTWRVFVIIIIQLDKTSYRSHDPLVQFLALRQNKKCQVLYNPHENILEASKMRRGTYMFMSFVIFVSFFNEKPHNPLFLKTHNFAESTKEYCLQDDTNNIHRFIILTKGLKGGTIFLYRNKVVVNVSLPCLFIFHLL